MKAEAIPVVKLEARRPPEVITAMAGKVLDPSADGSYLKISGAARFENAVGKLIVAYLPRVIDEDLSEDLWPIMSDIKEVTQNRSLASGSQQRAVGRTRYSNSIYSATVGSLEATGGKESLHRNAFCRLTTYVNTDELFSHEPVQQMFRRVREVAEAYEPERYAAQRKHAEDIEADWMILDTPWSTLTVNNTYPTGVHKDKGDLDAGVSCLLCLRRGDYSGGHLTFPEWGIGVDLQDGDLLLMDAHEWHGNTDISLISDDAERVSIVFYLRTLLTQCGTAEEEAVRREQSRIRQAERKARSRQERGIS